MGPINLTSPVCKIPFGKHKDTILWQAPTSWFRWLMEQEITKDTEDTIEAAILMKEREGEYAVLRKSKQRQYVMKLKSIHTTSSFAEAHCEDTALWKDYVYPIQSKQIDP